MKKIYSVFKCKTFLLALFFVASSSSVVMGQTCPYPIVQNFDPPANPPGSTAGFTGNFTYGSTTTAGVTNGYLVHDKVVAGSTYTLTSPTYKLPNTATFIGLGFFLDGTEIVGAMRISISYFSTASNSVETHAWGTFYPSYSGSSTSYQFCDQIFTSSLPGFATGGTYRIQIDFTPVTGAGNVGQTVTVDNFATNGTSAAAPLPVTFTGFDAKKVSGNVVLNWKVAGEENVVSYDVERSSDGRNFEIIANVTKTGQDSYYYTDAASSNAIVYYRVRNVDNDGKFKYSTIVRLLNGMSETVLKAFPQPVLGQLTLQHPAISGKALISITTADGRIIRQITPASGSIQSSIDMSTLQAGMYMIRFDSGDGNTQTMKVIKQ